MQFDRNKLKAIILYTCGRCPPEQLGAVKLHKVLYFLDMISYALSGHPVTGAVYKKRPFGPTCVPLLPALAEMQRDGQLDISHSEYFGYSKTQYAALQAPDLEQLSEMDLARLNEVIDFVCYANTARTISEFSHQAPWEMAELGDVIGYDTALLLFPSQASAEALDLVEAGERAFAKAGSARDTVGRSTYGDFRGRVLSHFGTA
jgi:hypothetical protein